MNNILIKHNNVLMRIIKYFGIAIWAIGMLGVLSYLFQNDDMSYVPWWASVYVAVLYGYFIFDSLRSHYTRIPNWQWCIFTIFNYALIFYVTYKKIEPTL